MVRENRINREVKMSKKPYREMTDDELRQAHLEWSARVGDASGWPSAYFAAKQVEIICKEGKQRRALDLVNEYPIMGG
jgi:hypothetical protein